MKSGVQSESDPSPWMLHLRKLDEACWEFVRSVVSKGGSITPDSIAPVRDRLALISDYMSDAPVYTLERTDYIGLLDISLRWKAFDHRYELNLPDFEIPEGDGIEVEPLRRQRLKYISATVAKKSGDKTIAVEYSTSRRHPRTGKTVRSTKKLLAHDEFNQASVGDVVLVKASRPLSKRKHHLVIAISSRPA